MNATYLRGIYLRLAGVVTLVVFGALLVNAYLSQRAFETALAPQMAAKVASVGASMRALVSRAVDSGVEFDQLFGVTASFDEIKQDSPEITSFFITDTQGKVQHRKGPTPSGANDYFGSAAVLGLLTRHEVAPPHRRVGDQYIVSMPVFSDAKPLGLLHMGVDVRFFDELVLDMMFDVVVVLVVSLFFTLELLHFIAGAKLEDSLRELGNMFQRGASGDFVSRRRPRSGQAFGPLMQLMDATLARVNNAYGALARELEASRRGPAHERPPGLAAAQAGLQALAQRCRFGVGQDARPDDESKLSKVRAPLFVFILAEELTRSFLPGYVTQLLVPVPGLSPEIVVGLPIALFMLIVAVGQPFMGVFAERVGTRRAMLMGAGLAAVGFVATSVAQSVLDLLLWRSLCALGYGVVFVAAQAFVLEHATPATRARSFALFVGAIMAATVCGPSIGGILADNIGLRPTFAIAALLAAGSMLVIRQLPDAARPAPDRVAVRLPSLRDIGSLLMNPRFMVVTGLAAIPAKILLTGICFYLIPLYVVSAGGTQAMAGRILMTYAVMMVMMAPLSASLATDRHRMHALVAGGLLISGLGGVLMLAGAGVGWIFVAVTLIGLGQSMSISAQSALVSEHCGAEIARMGEGVVYGVYRLLERLGNAAGPMIAALLLMHFDHRTGFVAIGGGVLLCGAAFAWATRNGPRPALATA